MYYKGLSEGIAFRFVYGIDNLNNDGVAPATVTTGNDNLFRSEIISNTIATLMGTDIIIKDTTRAVGAALAADVNAGDFKTLNEAFSGDENAMAYHPLKDKNS